MSTVTTDIEARNRRICATYNTYRSKPMKNSRHRGHKADALMHTAKTWKMPIREIRAILETAEAVKLGVDPKRYIAEKAVERSAKTTDWQKERDFLIARGYADEKTSADPFVMKRFLDFLQP